MKTFESLIVLRGEGGVGRDRSFGVSGTSAAGAVIQKRQEMDNELRGESRVWGESGIGRQKGKKDAESLT